MRGWLFLKALAREYRITLVAGSPAFPDESEGDLALLKNLVEDAVLLRFRASKDPGLLIRRLASVAGRSGGPSWDWADPSPTMRRRLRRLRSQGFSLVHLFRLYMLPVMSAALGEDCAIPVQLDMDDWESKTRQAVAEIAEPSRPELAFQLRTEASALAEEEFRWCPWMTRVFVCSQEDAAGLRAQNGLKNVLPLNNAVNVPPSMPLPGCGDVPELLFIGSLGYFPNQDAADYLLSRVLPGLRNKASGPFRLVIAGEWAPRVLKQRLQAEPLVTWIESPEHVEPLYRRAVAALAPIRAGGGTRIKVLEAFAQGRPVVATAAAVAGLDIEAGVHYIRADNPDEWIAALCGILDSPERRARIAESAFSWVRDYSTDAAMDRIAAILHEKG